MRWKVCILLVLAGSAQGAVPGIPDVRFSDSRVIGYPATNHKVLKQEMTVINTEECSATTVGVQLKVSPNCGYLRGVYHYRYQVPGQKSPVDLYMGFGLQGSTKKHTFMVSAPLQFAIAE